MRRGDSAGPHREPRPLASPPPMPPVPRQVPMFAAEPPQEPLPYGRWGDALGEHFEKAAETGIGDITWFPDRTWAGRTYVPATAPAEDGGEVFGYASSPAGDGRRRPRGLAARG